MSEQIVQVHSDFWNIRGDLRVGGLVNIGTHTSLLRRRNGRFLLLDSYSLTSDQKSQVSSLTENGTAVDAILNLHPFHTLHCRSMSADFPKAKIYGTRRHIERFPDMAWEDELCETPEMHGLFFEDLEFSVPRGVDFICADEKVHFSSVIAYHRHSQTLHVDDTLTYVNPPAPVRKLGIGDRLRFHPTLKKALKPRAGAATAFRTWARQLADTATDATTLCAAHVSNPLTPTSDDATLSVRIHSALDHVEPVLVSHEAKYG